MAATAQAQHEGTKDSQRAGIEVVRDDGKTYLRRKVSFEREGQNAVTSTLGTGTRDPARSQATLASLVKQYRASRLTPFGSKPSWPVEVIRRI